MKTGDSLIARMRKIMDYYNAVKLKTRAGNAAHKKGGPNELGTVRTNCIINHHIRVRENLCKMPA